MQIQTTLPKEYTPEHLVLKLHGVNYKQAFSELRFINDIVGEQFCSLWNDPLSYDLLTWYANVTLVEIDVKSETISDAEIIEQFAQNVEQNIYQLATKILVDAVVKTPLENPVLVKESLWTADKKFVENNPIKLNGQPITLIRHDFAEAMLSWMYSLSPQEMSTQLVTQDNSFYNTEPMQALNQTVLTTYSIKFKNKFMKEQFEFMGESLKEDTTKMDDVKKIIEEKLKERIEIETQKTKASEAALNDRIDKMEQKQGAAINDLKGKAMSQEKKMFEVEKEAYELKLANFRLEYEQTCLRAQIQARQQELAELQERLNKKRGGIMGFLFG